MVMTERNWRDAKIPAWVREAVEAEIKADQKRLALSWPNERKPEPLPFWWGDYDKLTGNPDVGTYYLVQGGGRSTHWKKVEIVEAKNLSAADSTRLNLHAKYAFRSEGFNWSSSPPRGPLFATPREAALYVLWERCEAAASDLVGPREDVARQSR